MLKKEHADVGAVNSREQELGGRRICQLFWAEMDWKDAGGWQLRMNKWNELAEF